VRLDPAREESPADSAIQRHQPGRPSSITFGPVQQVGADTEDSGHRNEETELQTGRLHVAVVRLVRYPRAHHLRSMDGEEAVLDAEPVP